MATTYVPASVMNAKHSKIYLPPCSCKYNLLIKQFCQVRDEQLIILHSAAYVIAIVYNEFSKSSSG